MILIKILTIALSLSAVYTEESNNDFKNNINEYADMASSFLSNQGAENIGGILSNLAQSDQGKQIGDMLMGMGENKNANQILQSLGSLMQNSGSGGGFDPSIMASVLGALGDGNQGGGGENPMQLLSMLGGMLGGAQDGGAGLMGMIPTLLSTISSFSGDEAQKRVSDHSGHAWFLPPVIEKLHIALDHFLNSELGISLMKTLGTEKFMKVFSDSNGKFSIEKIAELLENHSFRKHWIELVTRRIAGLISYFTDPSTQKR